VARFVPAVAALVLLLTGCSGVTDKVDRLMSSTSAATSTTTAGSPAAVTAQQVVDEFAAKGLPVPKPRDNSQQNCSTYKCSQLVTTDAITVATFADEAAATKYADAMAGAGGSFRHKLVVLSYAAAKTSASDRPKYEAALTALVP
jgi:hypothetical protein